MNASIRGRATAQSGPELSAIDQPRGGKSLGQSADGFLQPQEINWLGQVHGKPRGVALLDIVGRSESRECDARQGALGTEPPHQLQAAAVGQLDIADQEFDFDLPGHSQGGGQVAGGANVMAALGQHGGQIAKCVLVVFDQQDS